jgi:hypothetical protein
VAAARPSRCRLAFALLCLAPLRLAHGDTVPLGCPLTFYVEDSRIPPVSLGVLVFDVIYSPPAVYFAGDGTQVDCTALVAGATATFLDDDEAGRLRIDLRSASGISSFIQILARCQTVSASAPGPGSFTISLVEQTKVGGGAVSPPVAVRMLPVDPEECVPLATTTTTSTTSSSSTTTTVSTTTTLPPPADDCGDPSGDGKIAATDALFVLNVAVGLVACQLCVCDVDGSVAVTASDALALLAAAVGQAIELRCPPCLPTSGAAPRFVAG